MHSKRALSIVWLWAAFFATQLAAPPAFAQSENFVVQRGGIFEVLHDRQSAELGRHTMNVLQEGFASYAGYLPPTTQTIRVVVCETAETFRQQVGGYDISMVEGIARSEEGFIAVKAPSLLPTHSNYDSLLRHELLHVLLAQNTDPALLPRWLNEGVAMMMSGEFRLESNFRVARLYVTRNLIPYNQLNLSFQPQGSEEVFGDAYAQSLSMTKFLHDEVGTETFWAMIHALEEIPFDEALFRYTGWSTIVFYENWAGSLWQGAIMSALVSGFSLFHIGALLLIWAYFRKRRAGREIVESWEEEDGHYDEMEDDNIYYEDTGDPDDYEEYYFDDEEDERWY